MTTEIKAMMSSLTALTQRAPTEVSQPQTIASSPPSQVLQTPLVFSAHTEYLGTDYRHLAVQLNDQVIVYARTDGTAIAYDPRTQMVGQVPANLLNTENEPWRVEDFETYVSFSDYGKEANSRVGQLSWKAGEYIRVCRWHDVYKRSGLGLNLVSMETGQFYAESNFEEIKR